MTLQIASANPPRIVGPLYATATQGEPFACTVLVQNASSFWADPLPDGLLSDSATGIISGIPTTNGAFSVFLSASDGAIGFDWQELVLWIRPPYTTWLTDSGFTPEEQNNAAIGGEDADPDGDGMLNRNEFIAGTDPLDPDDALRLSLSFQNGALSLAWPGRENRRYAIQQSDTLTSGFTVMTNDIHAVFPSTEISMPASRPTAFFRIHVQE